MGKEERFFFLPWSLARPSTNLRQNRELSKSSRFTLFTMEEMEGHDLRFRSPSTFILGGPSQCGKTTFCFNLLRLGTELFEDSRCLKNVIFYFNQWQPSFDKVKQEENIVKEWVGMLPTSDDIIEKTEKYADDGGSVIILDDFAQKLNKDTIDIFSRVSHHTKSTIIAMVQNIFSKNIAFRDISLNSTYIVLFKNPRDASQIASLARQFAPGDTKYIVESYRDATKEPHTYVIFDMHQKTPDWLRVRTNIFPHEAPMLAFTSRKRKPTQ